MQLSAPRFRTRAVSVRLRAHLALHAPLCVSSARPSVSCSERVKGSRRGTERAVMLRLRRAQLAARRYASSSAAGTESVIELRQYTLHPAGVKPFLDLSAEQAEMRARLNPGFRGCVA